MAEHFIQGAIKHPGAMTAAAKREGVSNSAYEQEHKHDSGKAGQRARLAITLKHLEHGGVVSCPHCGKEIELTPEEKGEAPKGKGLRYGAHPNPT